MKVLVLGGGESGTGAALLAWKKNHEVLLSDQKKLKEDYRKVLSNTEITIEEESHDKALLFDADVVVKSPGIPFTVPVVQHFLEKGVEVIDELEWAFRHSKGKIVAITGSNGKTTTTHWVYHILQKAGKNVGLAGNVGQSWAGQLVEEDKDIWVLEVSSFQLDGIKTFRADVAIINNITPDHLDRYNNDMMQYVRSKMRITENQDEAGYLIVFEEDEWTQKGLKEHKTKATILPFSLESKPENGAWSNDKEVVVQTFNDDLVMTISEIALKGKHNVQNSMAAAIATRVLDVRKEIIRESLQDFRGVPHRLEYVATVHGIDFINDSKATNVNATWWALESASKPVIWVVGGVDKGNDYTSLLPLVQEKVKAIVCLGSMNEKIHETFKGIVPSVVDTQSARQAVEVAYQLGKKGDVVLLSPACASFDLFENYEDRGNQFKSAVRAL